MENQYYVYVYYYNEIAIYVGKGKGNRSHVHLKKCMIQKPGTLPFYDKLRSIISNGEMPEIKIIRDNLTNEESLKLEREIEIKIGTIREKTGTLLNQVECGVINPILSGDKNGMHGLSLYENWVIKHGKEIANQKMQEYIANMSKAIKGKKHNKESKNKMSNARKEWHANLDEDAKKTRSNNISKSWTEERSVLQSKRFAEINKNKTGKFHPRSRSCIIEGKQYDTIKQAQEAYKFKNHANVTFRINSPNFPDWNYSKD